jgi:WhiB family redox-sensing transcriptional regulator|tara:strand:+ start:4186 stop:4521 length:336 start_codon:yes stop_codon:yes gene_type:complete
MATKEYLSLKEILPTIQDNMWQHDANCSDADSTLFIPTEMQGRKVSELYKQAKSYCFECVVRPECLTFAIYNNMTEGVWGGLTPLQRKGLHKTNPVRDIFKKKDSTNGRTN